MITYSAAPTFKAESWLCCLKNGNPMATAIFQLNTLPWNDGIHRAVPKFSVSKICAMIAAADATAELELKPFD